ncbi:MAG TPA: chemotaxis protein CheW [Candidatus Saccharimonadales bacterium]|nr:chemotaxis protein CheW [Candidatus Saccharimonadales bacterium]
MAVEAQGRLCAVPLLNVVEIMRPLAIEAIAGAPLFVRGVAIIRGVPTPVVDLGVLLGAADGVTGGGITARFVTLHLGERQATLFVDAVCGVRELDALTILELPPLLQGASSDFIEAIGTLDTQMLVVLRSGWLIPEAVWDKIVPDRVPEAAR